MSDRVHIIYSGDQAYTDWIRKRAVESGRYYAEELAEELKSRTSIERIKILN